MRGQSLSIENLPKWYNVIPALVGVALAVIGMYALPQFGIRNTWGPIIGLPLCMVIGVAILARIAKDRA